MFLDIQGISVQSCELHFEILHLVVFLSNDLCFLLTDLDYGHVLLKMEIERHYIRL